MSARSSASDPTTGALIDIRGEDLKVAVVQSEKTPDTRQRRDDHRCRFLVCRLHIREVEAGGVNAWQQARAGSEKGMGWRTACPIHELDVLPDQRDELIDTRRHVVYPDNARISRRSERSEPRTAGFGS
jgi:hypothetical protein